MHRIIVLFTACLLGLYAQSYNEHILKIEAHIIPKIILMDYQFEKKLVSGKIRIVIIYNPNDKYIADKIASLIRMRYPEGIKSYGIEVVSIPYTQTGTGIPKGSLYYLMKSSSTHIQYVINQAKKNKTLLFTHDKMNLALGAHISLHFGKKITPLLNLKALKSQDIAVRPALLSISEVYSD